ncbi:MAG: SGNH/GDSL hydrolase family protein [Ferruginibacter sp.]|nr:SGNH/GDSL hydrolase family protein [Ferruginibacter sp.]
MKTKLIIFLAALLLAAFILAPAISHAQIKTDEYLKAKRVEAVDSLRLRGVWYKTLGGLVDSIRFRSSTFVDTVVQYSNGGTKRVIGLIDRKSALITGGIVSLDSGSRYDISAAAYIINSVRTTSIAQKVTLSPAPAGDSGRFDVIALNSLGLAVVIKGVTSLSPQLPQLDALTQLYITHFLVKTGSSGGGTGGGNIVVQKIYDENIEWSTGEGGVIPTDFNNTNNTYTGSKSIRVPPYTSPVGNKLLFQSPASVTLSNFSVLKLHLKRPLGISDIYLSAQFLTSNISSSSIVDFTVQGQDVASSAYETITIPMSSFIFNGISTGTQILVIRVQGSSTQNIYIDAIELQSNIPQGGGGGGTGGGSGAAYVTSVYQKAGTDSVFYIKNGVDFFVCRVGAGGGGGSQSFQQTTDIDSVTSHRITVPQVLFTPVGFYQSKNNYIDSLVSFGNSITVGVGSTGDSTSFAKKLAQAYNLPFKNLGENSSGSWLAAKYNNQYVQPNHNNIITVMSGLNDLRKGGASTKTLAKILNSYASILNNSFLKTFAAGGSSSILKYGTWSSYDAKTVGGKNTIAITSTITNDSLVYSFIDSSVTIALIGTDGVNFDYANFSVYIDNVLKGNYLSNNRTDGIADYTNNNRLGSFSLIYKGLAAGAHKIKIINSNGKPLVVDYIGHWVDKKFAKPILIFDDPKMTAAGYAITGFNFASDVVIDSLNSKTDSLIANYSDYPIYKVRTNNFYTPVVKFTNNADDVHPNDLGYTQIKNAGLAAFTYTFTLPAEGTQRYDIVSKKLSWFNGTRWESTATSSTTDSSDIVHKSGTETLTGIKYIGGSITSTSTTLSTVTSQLRITSNITPVLDNDSMAGIVVKPVFNNLAFTNLKKYSILAYNDINVSGVTIGTGKSNNSSNVVFGKDAFRSVTNGAGMNCTAVGLNALINQNDASYQNSAFGSFALQSITSGVNNTAGGTNSMYATSGASNNNTAWGYASLGQVSGDNNTGIGYNAGRIAASAGVFLGFNAGFNETNSNKLYVANSVNNNLLHGDFSTKQLQINAASTPVLTPSAALEVISPGNNTGLLIPRMTKTQRDAISSPAQGLMVFVTDNGGYLSWYNSGWQKVSSIAD